MAEQLEAGEALLRHAEDADSLLLGTYTHDASQPRRQWRLRRMDLACMVVVGFVVSFVCITQPSMRTENPLFMHRPLPTQATASTARDRDDIAHSIAPVGKGYLTYADLGSAARQHGYQVEYQPDHGFVIDGRASLMLGGSIVLGQSSMGVSEHELRTAKNDGLNYIQLDLDWGLHEPTPEEWNFAGRANLTQLYELAAREGLLVRIRIRPSTPLWLDTKHTQTSTLLGNQALERFVRKIVDVSGAFMASRGGPIISMRIDSDLAIPDPRYWAALVQQLETSIRWELPVEANADTNSPAVASSSQALETDAAQAVA